MRRFLPLCAFVAAYWLDGEKEFFLGLAQGFRNQDLSTTCLTDEIQGKLETDTDAVADDYDNEAGSKTLVAHLAVVGNDLVQVVHDCDLTAIPVAASTAIQTEGLSAVIERAIVHVSDISESIKQFEHNVDTNFYAAGQAIGEAFSYLFPNQHRLSSMPVLDMDLHKDFIGDVVYNFTTGLATGLQSTNATSKCLSSIQHIRLTANTFYNTVLNCTKLQHSACLKVETSFSAIFKEYSGIVDGCKFPVLEAKLETLGTFDGWVNVFHNLYKDGNNHVLQLAFMNLKSSIEKDNYYMIGLNLGVIIRLTLNFSV